MKKTDYQTVRDSLIDQGVVFFGSYATPLYLNYLPKQREQYVKTLMFFPKILKTTLI